MSTTAYVEKCPNISGISHELIHGINSKVCSLTSRARMLENAMSVCRVGRKGEAVNLG